MFSSAPLKIGRAPTVRKMGFVLLGSLLTRFVKMRGRRKKMICANDAREKAQKENSKLSPMVLTLIDQKIRKACKEGLMRTSVQIGIIPLEDRHVKHVLAVLEQNGYGCRADRLRNAFDEPGDWVFEITW